MTAPPPASEPSRPVARRHVFYIAGFDPRGARHYHALYREEARLQARVSGYGIEVGARRAAPEHNVAWDVSADIGGQSARAEIEFLRWDDVVRAHWPRGGFAITRAVFGSYAHALRRGVVARVLATSWPFAITMAFGFLLVAAALVLAAAIPFAVARGVGAPGWLAILLAAAAAIAAASQLHRLDPVSNALWLGRTLAFIVADARGRAPDYVARQQAFAERLVAVVRAGAADEVLVVGHSVGTQTAVGVVARALEAAPDLAAAGPRLALLTLGSTMPLLALCPEAAQFRDDLARVAAAEGLAWIDIGAPPDPACFALTDPLAAAGRRARPDPAARPKLVSPRFHDIVEPQLFRQMRKDRMRMHFQYLMAGQNPGLYDYFAITAGPLCLADRFAAEKSRTDFRRLALLS